MHTTPSKLASPGPHGWHESSPYASESDTVVSGGQGVQAVVFGSMYCPGGQGIHPCSSGS